MCGIAGAYGQFDVARLDRMVTALRHRGPDDCGMWLGESVAGVVALGNARLSIIDLSSAGHMPMSGNGCWVTYNGEIYNFEVLRTELVARGHQFFSRSDTEVLLAAYREWGTECVQHLRGMFAFALYDPADQGRLFLARDHFGIKPLYHAEVDGALLFASEIRSLLASDLIPRKVDRQAVWDYLSAGSVIAPRTIIAGISELLAGHAMLIQPDGPGKVQAHCWRWWDLAESASKQATPPTYEDASQQVRHLLEESVRLHRIADVPVGAFLSGGLDSSTIVGLMATQSAKPLHTYAVAFHGAGASADELVYARTAAERFGTLHVEVIITPECIPSLIEEVIAALDQPSVDGINTYAVSRAARRDVTVVLSGLGGDELFGGYPQFGRLASIPPWLRDGSAPLANLIRKLPMLPGRIRLPLEFLAASPVARFAISRRWFSEHEKEHLLSAAWMQSAMFQPIAAHYADLLDDRLDAIAQTTYVETRAYMSHTLLRDSDALSMAHSLELRVPFLDVDLASFVFALPTAWKWHQGRGKRILANAVRDLLPQDILERPKQGFDFPYLGWLRGVLFPMLHETLSDPRAQAMLSLHARQHLDQVLKSRQGYRMWNLFVLVRWLIRHEIEVS